MISGALVLYTSNVAQAVGALVLALALASFYRLYQRPYLLSWAWSWSAFCAALLAGTAAVFLVPYLPPQAPARLTASSLSLLAAYWQAAWLLFGTWEMVTSRVISRRFRNLTLAALALLSLAFILGTLQASPYQRLVLRFGLRSLFLGLAFLTASVAVWRARLRPSGFGRRVVAASFLLYGLHQLHYFVVMVSPIQVGSTSYAAYLGPFDFLFQAVMGIGMVIWLLEDERQRAMATSSRIEHLAYHDFLTDLPNRTLLLQYLKTATEQAGAHREQLAVLFLDLDRFKVVNESLGNRSGDELLKSVAERLRGRLRSTDLVARVGTDEFAVLLPAVESEAAVFRVAEKVLEIIRLPFSLQEREIYLTASLGVSRFPEDGRDAEALLKHAETAMYRAKETHRDQYRVYAPSMDTNSLEQLSLEADLRKALAPGRGELILFYQPVVDSSQRRIEGVEALLRWQHPKRGLLPPGDFLGLAEASGLGVPLDLWVLRTACQEIQSWRETGTSNLRLAVNLSPRSFQQPDLLGRIQEVLVETGLPPSCIEIEITETLAMQNAEATLAVLQGLKELGVRIAIDDFGTGYSSLSYLTTFPIDTLKVDRSFVKTLGAGHGSEEVAAAVIALAVSLEIGVIAEGVEDQVQWRWLQGLGCERFQGFLFSPPLPAGECRELLANGGVDERIRRAEAVA